MGIDIWEVIEAAATKPFGFQPFYPGPGLGGHCIPVDPFYLSWKAKEWDFRTRFIELAGEINIGMPYHVVGLRGQALNQQKKALNGAKVLVLGLAYKKDIDDLRESPALTIIELLQEQGAEVSYNDPYFPTVGKGRKYDLQMKCTPLDNLGQYDCVLIVTDHSDYDYQRIVRIRNWWSTPAMRPKASRAQDRSLLGRHLTRVPLRRTLKPSLGLSCQASGFSRTSVTQRSLPTHMSTAKLSVQRARILIACFSQIRADEHHFCFLMEVACSCIKPGKRVIALLAGTESGNHGRFQVR